MAVHYKIVNAPLRRISNLMKEKAFFGDDSDNEHLFDSPASIVKKSVLKSLGRRVAYFDGGSALMTVNSSYDIKENPNSESGMRSAVEIDDDTDQLLEEFGNSENEY